VTKEKSDKIFLLEAGNAVNSRLLTSFLTKSRKILDIFTRYLDYAKVSFITTLLVSCFAITHSAMALQAEPEVQDATEAVEIESADPVPNAPEKPPGNQTGAATRFNPTEKIRADDAVSFPVDI
jgi:hypothetical protein